jgi:hypothetical protein
MSQISIGTHPNTTALTTLRRVKVEMGLSLTDTSLDELLGALIDEASQAIESYCGRAFARAVVTETLSGTGRMRLMVSRTPVAAVSAVVYNDSTISSSEYAVEDGAAGFLYRDDGWYWTVSQDASDLVPRYVPSLATNEYAVTYTGGYLLPGDNLSLATLSITSSTDCVKDSASGMPLLVAGDRVTTAGWNNATNNRTMTVLSRTAAKVVVNSTVLVDEASTDQPRTLTVRNLPADVERACVETVKAWYLGRLRDPRVTAKSVGDLSLSFNAAANDRAIPASVTKILSAYKRFS